MENFTLLLLVFSFIATAIGEEPLVPAVYFFGDSGTDAGNNNYLDTPAKANVFPYGIDLNNQTGRFTNGKTVADFMAELLGLPMAPAYMSLDKSARSRTTTGINYASGGCGILDDTGVPGCLRLRKQVQLFNSTVKEDLPNAIQNTETLRVYLAESICFLIIGSNDKFFKLSPKWNETNNEQVFDEYLFQNLVQHIETLYGIGARKFVVHNVYAPHLPFPDKLKQLQSRLSNSTLTAYDINRLTAQVLNNLAKYGFKHGAGDSCINATVKVCDNRDEYLYFDEVHCTQKGHQLSALDCFNGTMTCTPYNLLALAQAKVPSTSTSASTSISNIGRTSAQVPQFLVLLAFHVFLLLLLVHPSSLVDTIVL